MSQPAVRRPDVTRKANDAARALTVGLRAWSLVSFRSSRAGPEHAEEVFDKFALATSSLEPALALEVLEAEDASDELQPIRAALKRAFDEQQVALLLARAMARARGATRRLAQILDTLAPDEDRRERVLKMTSVAPQADRAAEILVSLGPEAIGEIAQRIDDKRWWIQRSLA